MRSLLSDVRSSWRGMLARPGFSVVVILTLALGIGANTAVFSVAVATLGRGLPYQDPDRIATVWQTRDVDDFSQIELSYPTFLDVRARQTSFSSFAGFAQRRFVLSAEGRGDLVEGGVVVGPFFDVLGVKAALGRTLGPSDDRPEAPAVVVLGHGAWLRRFGGAPDVIGRTILLDDTPTTVVGVLPRSFSFAPFQGEELVLPARPTGGMRDRRNLHWLHGIGRLAPGIALPTAQAELTAIAHQLGVDHPDSNQGGMRAIPLGDEVLGKVRPILWVLLAAVGLVLLVACANVANLILARQAGRQKELAIRAALGASRARLFALLTVDGVVHALAAGVAGLLVAVWGVDALVGAIPAGILAKMPYLAGARVDATVLLFGLGMALLCGLAVGALPALRASSPALHDRLKEEGRASPGRAQTRLRDTLVVTEVALAFVLLAGAGLITRSLWRVLSVNPGFEPRGVTTAQVVLPDALAPDIPRAAAATDAILERVRALPGVTDAAMIDILPAGNGGNTIRFVDTARPVAPGEVEPEALIRGVSPNYFALMRVPLAAGRFFDAHERPHTVIVNQTLARRIFHGDAVGKRIVFTFSKDQPAREIVGVVGDEHMGPLDRSAAPAIYVTGDDAARSYLAIVARGNVQPQAMARAIGEVGAGIAVYGLGTMSERIARQPWMFVRRFPAILVASFAAIALLLAMIGIYGVLAYTVRQRTHEIGVRRAIGAQGRHIASMLLGHSAALVGLGIGLGLAVALVATRMLGSVLFGVSPSDPLTLAAAAGLLLVVALAASWLPARRAMSVDPLEALRPGS